MTMPGNKLLKCAPIKSSKGINRLIPLRFVSTKRGRTGGTLTRAKNSSPVTAFFTMTARLSERPDMYGNGCEGSTASGVSTGKIRSLNSVDV
ncbi:unannotated protein [freshwater metagenome]|uniref:Unannotated protein n=1 Tax=freshwater metagenome TaxID=449393 RepID=A0A6J6Q3T7_9ZZZZ